MHERASSCPLSTTFLLFKQADHLSDKRSTVKHLYTSNKNLYQIWLSCLRMLVGSIPFTSTQKSSKIETWYESRDTRTNQLYKYSHHGSHCLHPACLCYLMNSNYGTSKTCVLHEMVSIYQGFFLVTLMCTAQQIHKSQNHKLVNKEWEIPISKKAIKILKKLTGSVCSSRKLNAMSDESATEIYGDIENLHVTPRPTCPANLKVKIVYICSKSTTFRILYVRFSSLHVQGGLTMSENSKQPFTLLEDKAILVLVYWRT